MWYWIVMFILIAGSIGMLGVSFSSIKKNKAIAAAREESGGRRRRRRDEEEEEDEYDAPPRRRRRPDQEPEEQPQKRQRSRAENAGADRGCMTTRTKKSMSCLREGGDVRSRKRPRSRRDIIGRRDASGRLFWKILTAGINTLLLFMILWVSAGEKTEACMKNIFRS